MHARAHAEDSYARARTPKSMKGKGNTPAVKALRMATVSSVVVISISTRSMRPTSWSRTSRARFIDRCWMKFSKHQGMEKPDSTHWFHTLRSVMSVSYTHLTLPTIA